MLEMLRRELKKTFEVTIMSLSVKHSVGDLKQIKRMITYSGYQTKNV